MASLEDKITSEAQLAPFGRVNQKILNAAGTDYYIPWWLRREWLRIEKGIYPPPSEVITNFNKKLPQFALHVSKEDPNYIAYTPDKASGEADRQLKTTLGKFIAKYYPHYKDEEVGQLVADHLGEVTGEVELLYGADIAKVYNELSSGVGSCMTKDTHAFNVEGHHPTEVYDMPNIGIAIVRSASGAITGRSMVYMPSETDKRYIRIYGDQKLEKRLRRADFKPGCWHGAEFKKIKLGYSKGYVMPYLDGEGTVGSPSRSSVVLLDGKLMSVYPDRIEGIRSACGSEAIRVCTSTGGYYNFIDVTTSQFHKACAVSGKMVNCLVDKLHPFYLKDDYTKKVMVCEEVYDAGIDIHIRNGQGGYPNLYRTTADIVTFYHGGRTFPDTEDQRKWAGFRKLDARHYPDEQDWILPAMSWEVEASDGYKQSGEYLIKGADAVQAVVAGQLGWVHQQEVDKGWTKIHSISKGVVLYADTLTKVEKTSTGRKVVEGVHDIRHLYDGTWEFKRNVERTRLFGTYFWHLRSESFHPGDDNSYPYLVAHIEDRVREGYSVYEIVISTLKGYVSDYIIYKGKALYEYNWRGLPAWPEMYALSISYLESSGLSDSTAMKTLKQLNRYYSTFLAEAEAIDYNGQHDVSMNTCVEPEPVTGATVSLPTGGTSTAEWLRTATTIVGTGSMYSAILPAATVLSALSDNTSTYA
jgi:hypothetical protein